MSRAPVGLSNAEFKRTVREQRGRLAREWAAIKRVWAAASEEEQAACVRYKAAAEDVFDTFDRVIHLDDRLGDAMARLNLAVGAMREAAAQITRLLPDYPPKEPGLPS